MASQINARSHGGNESLGERNRLSSIKSGGRIGGIIGKQARFLDMGKGAPVFGADHARFHKFLSEERNQPAMRFNNISTSLNARRP